ncbi:hypothetical protein AVEN_64483-1 [Araneus ventricosus]|uniref:Uncharacterized protein n=1 Tax=Araneus ventricosus TaxID=182803 RepID=A0A4Y2RCM1_ARAVE|nr:hypothetical protein AVEN_64483-1 [Araneus ventricosus]
MESGFEPDVETLPLVNRCPPFGLIGKIKGFKFDDDARRYVRSPVHGRNSYGHDGLGSSRTSSAIYGTRVKEETLTSRRPRNLESGASILPIPPGRYATAFSDLIFLMKLSEKAHALSQTSTTTRLLISISWLNFFAKRDSISSRFYQDPLLRAFRRKGSYQKIEIYIPKGLISKVSEDGKVASQPTVGLISGLRSPPRVTSDLRQRYLRLPYVSLIIFPANSPPSGGLDPFPVVETGSDGGRMIQDKLSICRYGQSNIKFSNILNWTFKSVHRDLKWSRVEKYWCYQNLQNAFFFQIYSFLI